MDKQESRLSVTVKLDCQCPVMLADGSLAITKTGGATLFAGLMKIEDVKKLEAEIMEAVKRANA